MDFLHVGTQLFTGLLVPIVIGYVVTPLAILTHLTPIGATTIDSNKRSRNCDPGSVSWVGSTAPIDPPAATWASVALPSWSIKQPIRPISLRAMFCRVRNNPGIWYLRERTGVCQRGFPSCHPVLHGDIVGIIADAEIANSLNCYKVKIRPESSAATVTIVGAERGVQSFEIMRPRINGDSSPKNIWAKAVNDPVQWKRIGCLHCAPIDLLKAYDGWYI